MPLTPAEKPRRRRARKADLDDLDLSDLELEEVVPAPVPSTHPNEGARLIALQADRTTDGDVARKLGVSRMTLYRWFEGTIPRAPAQARACEVYGVPAASWTEPARPDPPPPTREQLAAALFIDGSFLRFLEHGPPKLQPTRQQKVFIRVVFQGEEPGALVGEDRQIARIIFGDVDVVPELARRRNVIRIGKVSGKTTICAAWVAFRMLTCDLSEAGAVDIPVAVLFSRRSKTTRVVFRMARDFLKGIPLVEEALDADTSEELLFRRPTDGRLVQLSTIVRSPGGDAGRGIWIICAVLDEAEFTGQTKGDDSAIQDVDVVIALESRYLDGAALYTLSTPWYAPSWAGEQHADNWGRPTTALAATAPTLLMRDNDPRMAKRRAAMMASNPREALREFDCICGEASASALIPAALVDAATTTQRIEETGRKVCAGFDPAFQEDPSALCVTERQGNRLVVVLLAQRVPEAVPREPSAVCRELFDLARDMGAQSLACDNHEEKSTRRAAADVGVKLRILSNKSLELALYVRDLVREKKLVIPATRGEPGCLYALLVRQMKAIGLVERPGGTKAIVRPRTKALYHCDLMSALEAAADEDRLRHGPIKKDTTPRHRPKFGGLRTGFST